MTKRTLVVEDHEDNRRILRDLLRAGGYEMIEAHDGEAALDKVAAERFDLVYRNGNRLTGAASADAG